MHVRKKHELRFIETREFSSVSVSREGQLVVVVLRYFVGPVLSESEAMSGSSLHRVVESDKPVSRGCSRISCEENEMGARWSAALKGFR